MTLDEVDLGGGYAYSWIGWHPDRSIEANAQRYKDMPDIDKVGILLRCPHGRAGIYIDTPPVREVFKHGPHWTLVQEEPLTLEPSIHRIDCGCHGFIREDKWVPA